MTLKEELSKPQDAAQLKRLLSDSPDRARAALMLTQAYVLIRAARRDVYYAPESYDMIETAVDAAYFALYQVAENCLLEDFAAVCFPKDIPSGPYTSRPSKAPGSEL